MRELIIMPIRDNNSVEEQSQGDVSGKTDLSVWKAAPAERTTPYFPTYSSVSKAMQTAMRSWVREWFQHNTEILLRPHTAYPILVYQCTHPFSGKPTNIFTYDIQQTEALNRAFASAAFRLSGELKKIDTRRFDWFTREHYFAYRSKEVVKYVAKNEQLVEIRPDRYSQGRHRAGRGSPAAGLRRPVEALLH